MQLTSGSLRAALGSAVSALLVPALAPAAAQAQTQAGPKTTDAATSPDTTTWQAEGAVLLYKEGAGRVTALEPVVSLRRVDGNERAWGLKLTLDALTGASPNGAVAQPGVQTFTTPSGKSTYSTPAGRMPLDPTFRDTRLALAATHERPVGAAARASFGLGVSAEHDFASVTASAALAYDLAQKNTTLSLGVALEADRIQPEGGVPQGLQAAGPARASGTATRQVADLLLGVTQVMNRRWVTQLNLGLGRGTGHQSDPYKVLSVVDGTSGLLTGDRLVHEQRPEQRTRVSLFWQNKVHLTDDVVDASYRYYSDNWGVRAHTLDLRWRSELGSGWYLEPRVRLHRQSAADFYRPWLLESTEWDSAVHRTALTAASADPRLAAFTGRTLGLKLGLPLRRGEFAVRLEAYRQQQRQPAFAPGALRGLELAPALTAATVFVGYVRPF